MNLWANNRLFHNHLLFYAQIYDNYRGISLLSIAAKVLARTPLRRLCSLVERNVFSLSEDSQLSEVFLNIFNLGLLKKTTRNVTLYSDLFHQIGQYLYQAVTDTEDLDIAFVWNRTSSSLKEKVAKSHVLEDLSKFADR